ncbi:hypothetical protein HaLaN_29111 [Haematococcus lacustris]|uniref:Uncharacterized protein n=1 Tax=Haematococcus lacustris TaxID=44745 RepID=A0A6A0ABP5_HAELA|nr:hypothetical protein HaLaN_29111 [Haematococcus lacustris]
MPHTINSAYDLAFELEVLRELLSSRQRRFSHYSELEAVQATEAWQKERLIGTTTPALLTLECLQEVRNDFVKVSCLWGCEGFVYLKSQKQSWTAAWERCSTQLTEPYIA